MSDQIKASDVLDPNLFDTTKAERYLETIELVELGLRELLETSKKILATAPFRNSKDILDYNKLLIQTAQLEERLTKIESEKFKVLQAAEKFEQQRIKTTVEKQKAEERYNAAIDKQTKLTEKQAKEQAKLNSEYEQANAALNKLAKRQMDNSIAGREMSKTARLVAEAHNELKAKVEKAEQSVGRFNRNVGNYKSGFNGLQNSINQLTREFPAFANSVQTGFMALSNNIPMFFDEIKRANAEIKTLREQGEQTPGLFSRLTSSLFSWGTALSIGVTLLTVYGKELVQFTANLFKADDAFKTSAELRSTQYSKLTEIIDKRIEAELKLRVLEGKMTEEEADAFRLRGDKMKQMIILEENFRKERQEIAAKYSRNISEIDGTLEGSEGKSGAKYGPFNMKRFKDNDAINAAFIEAKKKHDTAVQELEKANQKELELIKATSDKEAKDKAQTEEERKQKEYDHRIISEMEELREKREKSEENYKKWKYESDEEQTKNELQNIKTISDAEIEANNATVKSIEELQQKKKKAAEEDKKRTQEELSATLKFAEEINAAKNNATRQQLDNELAMRQRNIEQQQQLAIAGKDNTLAFEKAAAVKAEREQQELVKKQERQAKALAFIKLISAYADKGETDQATTKALIQMAIAGAIAGSYYEGTESVEDDLKGNKIHNGRDGYVIAVDGKERILNPAQNAMIGDLSNDELAKLARDYNEGYLPKYITDTDTGSFAQNTTNALLLQQVVSMNNRIQSLEKTLKERPVPNINLDNLGNVISSQIVNGFIKQSKKKNNSPLNYL